jgi:hypothetical protein
MAVLNDVTIRIVSHVEDLVVLHFQTFHKKQVIMVERTIWLGIVGPG